MIETIATEIVSNKEYFWLSQKDGVFYTLKLNSINHQGNYNMFIENFVHLGYHSPAPRERIGNIKTFHRKNLPIYTDFSLIHLDFLLDVVLTSKKYFEYQKMIEICFDLYDLLQMHPDRYIKYIDRLLNIKMFRKILDNELKRPLS